MDYRQLLISQANALAAAGCYGGNAGSGATVPSSYSAASSAAAAAAAAAYSQSAARTYSYRLWTLANVLSDPCRPFFLSFLAALSVVLIASIQTDRPLMVDLLKLMFPSFTS